MKLLFLIATLATAVPAIAEDSSWEAFLEEDRALANRYGDGIMHVNGREFWMGDLHDWPYATADFSVSFMVRSSIWLREFLDRDPILMHQDFEIRRTRDSSFTGRRYLASQMELEPDPPRDCDVCYYEETFDAHIQVDGYHTYFNGYATLLFLPIDQTIAHGFRCYVDNQFAETGEFISCSVYVVYPHATNIVLTGYRYQPGTISNYGRNFRAIAERMLEVVTCIDITDQPNLGEDPGQSFLLESYPQLKNCGPELTG